MVRKRDESGSALIIATIIVIIVIGIGGAFLADTVFKQKAAFDTMESDEAQLICDATLEKVRRALFVYKSQGTVNWNAILALHLTEGIDPDQHSLEYMVLKDTTEWDQYLANWTQPGLNTADEAPLMTDPDWFLGPTKPFGKGGFKCIVKDNDDGDADLSVDFDLQVLVYITATLPDGTQRQIEALVKFANPTYEPDHAIIVDGNLLLNGTPDVIGLKGKSHSNLDTFLQGGANFSVSANAVGQVNGAPANPSYVINDVDQGSAPPYIDLPDVVPSTYKPLTQYTLTSTGTVIDNATGSPIAGTGWSYDAGTKTWKLSGNTIPPAGAYYVDAGGDPNGGNVQITGAGNTPSRTLTIIAEGSITTTGNVKLTPFLEGTLLLSGKDIKLGGTAGASFQGLVAAHEQVKTFGTFDMKGSILAKDAEDLSTVITSASALDTTDGVGGQVSGTALILYDGGLNTVLENPNNAVTIENLRRLK